MCGWLPGAPEVPDELNFPGSESINSREQLKMQERIERLHIDFSGPPNDSQYYSRHSWMIFVARGGVLGGLCGGSGGVPGIPGRLKSRPGIPGRLKKVFQATLEDSKKHILSSGKVQEHCRHGAPGTIHPVTRCFRSEPQGAPMGRP